MKPIFLETARGPKKLDEQFNKTISEIKASLYPQVTIVKPPQDLWINTVHNGRSIEYIPSEERIVEIYEEDLRANYATHDLSTLRGKYDPRSGKIFLCRDLWCRKTLIHESPHSVSFFASDLKLEATLHDLYEGFTELLCGFVMFRHHSCCYDAWRHCSQEECLISSDYGEFARLLAASCRTMPVLSIAKLYFWDRTEIGGDSTRTSLMRSIAKAIQDFGISYEVKGSR